MDLEQALWRQAGASHGAGRYHDMCSWRCLWLGGGSCDTSRDMGRQEGPKAKSEVWFSILLDLTSHKKSSL